jgi:hypothetical protein
VSLKALVRAADEDDRVRLQIQGFKTLDEVRGFLAGRQAVRSRRRA